MSEQIARDLLREFGARIKLPMLGLDEEGNACVDVDEAYVINLEYDADEDALLLYTWLGLVPERNTAEILRRLLSANYFWTENNGATLSIEEETNGIVLVDRTGCHAFDINQFESRMQGYMNVVERWLKILDGSEEEPELREDAAPPSGFLLA